MSGADHGPPLTDLHLIHVQALVLVSRHPWASWREIQRAFRDYTASSGPWDEREVIEFLVDEYTLPKTAIAMQVQSLDTVPGGTIVLDFEAARAGTTPGSPNVVVDKSLFERFAEVDADDRGTMSWLEARLRELDAHVSARRGVVVHDPGEDALVSLFDVDALRGWIGRHFPNVRDR